MRSVENGECGKWGVWKTRSVENGECGKRGVHNLTNAQLHLTKRKMSSNGSANVKHSEAISDEIVTAMSTACGASIFLFQLFKKNLESICSPSYEMNAGSWQAWVLITGCMQYMNIEQNNKLL